LLDFYTLESSNNRTADKNVSQHAKIICHIAALQD